jgi:hypothetical protein
MNKFSGGIDGSGTGGIYEQKETKVTKGEELVHPGSHYRPTVSWLLRSLVARITYSLDDRLHRAVDPLRFRCDTWELSRIPDSAPSLPLLPSVPLLPVFRFDGATLG